MRRVTYKPIRKSIFRFLMIFFFSFIVFNHLYAQDDGDGDPTDNPPGSGDPDIPLDGGVVVLVAAAVGYGIKKIIETKQLKHKDVDLLSYNNYQEL